MRTRVLIVALAAAGLALAACYPPVPPGEAYAVRWAQVMSGPTNEDEIDGVATRADGSVFVTGKFEGTASIAGTTLKSAGHADIPLARFDAFGRTRWVQRFGGGGEDNLFDIDADGAGAVGTGWFEGTVGFGTTQLTAAGASDCVVVAVNNDGSVRWAHAFGGPLRDGCNEVTIGPDGSIVTSLDTEGGWTPPGVGPIPQLPFSDTLLVRISRDGELQWMRRVGGPGPQRGKSLAVAPDGRIAFGGDSFGPVTIGTTNYAGPGAQRDAWLSEWSAGGTLRWAETWGGPGDDLAKGVVYDGCALFVIGPFTGTIELGGTTLDAGSASDLALARFRRSGSVVWATSVSATLPVSGAEITTAPDGGVLFGATRVPGMEFRAATGAATPLDERHGGTAYLAQYRADGSVAFATTIAGTASGNVGEIARASQRVYVDIVLRGQDNSVNGTPIATRGKDASVWGIDLAGGDGASS